MTKWDVALTTNFFVLKKILLYWTGRQAPRAVAQFTVHRNRSNTSPSPTNPRDITSVVTMPDYSRAERVEVPSTEPWPYSSQDTSCPCVDSPSMRRLTREHVAPYSSSSLNDICTVSAWIESRSLRVARRIVPFSLCGWPDYVSLSQPPREGKPGSRMVVMTGVFTVVLIV